MLFISSCLLKTLYNMLIFDSCMYFCGLCKKMVFCTLFCMFFYEKNGGFLRFFSVFVAVRGDFLMLFVVGLGCFL